MKILKHILGGAFVVVFAVACNDGIDSITRVDPGSDEAAPTVKINYPGEGTLIRVKEDVTPIDIDFEVTDDIEIKTITVSLDGAQIAAFDEFKDYRRVLQQYRHDELTNGEHTLQITATDLADQSTSQSVTFEKVEPYQPIYEGEVFYMPFDGDYVELVSIKNAARVGNPGFAEGKLGQAYKGAEDSHLSFPSEGLATGVEFSAAFWLKIDASDTRAGILSIAPAEPAAPSDKPSGFGLIREGSATSQAFILLVGNGTNATWVNPGAPATINPTTQTGWLHFAITISETEVAFYMNGEQVGSNAEFPGIDWTGVGDLSIMSGAPNFSGWDHKMERGQMDELRLFNKALTKEEIQAMIN